MKKWRLVYKPNKVLQYLQKIILILLILGLDCTELPSFLSKYYVYLVKWPVITYNFWVKTPQKANFDKID